MENQWKILTFVDQDKELDKYVSGDLFQQNEK